MRSRILAFLLFFSYSSFSQEIAWELNPKVLTDTIELVKVSQGSIESGRMMDFFVDHEGQFWLSSYDYGLLRYDYQLSDYLRLTRSDGKAVGAWCSLKLTPDGEDGFWVGTDLGLRRFDLKTQNYTFYKPKGSMVRTESVKVEKFLPINDSVGIIGREIGPFIYNYKKDSILTSLRESHISDDISEGTSEFVYDMVPDPMDENFIYGCSSYGLFRLNVHTFEKTYIPCPYSAENLNTWKHMWKIVTVGNSLYISYKVNAVIKYDTEEGKWGMVRRVVGGPDGWNKMYIAYLHTMEAYGSFLFFGLREKTGFILDARTDSLHQIWLSHPDFNSAERYEGGVRVSRSYLKDTRWQLIDRNGYLWSGTLQAAVYRSAEPILLKNEPITFGEIKLKNVKIDQELIGKSFNRNQKEGFVLDLGDHQEILSFNFGLVNPSVDDIAYQYSYNNGPWKTSAFDKDVFLLKTPNKRGDFVLQALRGDQLIDEVQFRINVDRPLIKKRWFQYFIGCTLIFLGISSLYFFFERAKTRNRLEKQIAEVEMQALRSQMNPHFLFNSLNSIKHYALQKSTDETAEYITTFSRLVRQILQNSNEKLVTLDQELKAISLYVDVESKRFEDRFNFELKVDYELDSRTFFIPPMILQPYVENAIWHGLMHKETDGILRMNLQKEEDGVLIEISDNGIGRALAAEIKKKKSRYKKKSLGTLITTNRLDLIEQIYGVAAKVTTRDLFNEDGSPSGTSVKIFIPEITKEQRRKIETTEKP